jgi:hypothetical protein
MAFPIGKSCNCRPDRIALPLIRTSTKSLQVVFSVTTFILVCFLPESPRFLISKGKDDEARDVLDMLDHSLNPEERKVAVVRRLFR